MESALTMTPEQMILLTGIGLVAGCMSGLFGIGGGAVRIPLLNLAGVPLLNAFALNLLVIPLTQATGACIHRKNIDLRMAFYVVIGGSVGSMISALFTGIITVRALAVVFVVISFLTVFGIYLDRLAPRISEALVPAPHNLVLGALLLNLLTGIRGGSGGSLFPPFLRAMHLDIRRAIATSIFVTIFTATAGLLVYGKRGDILWMHGLFVLVGSVIGTGVGSRLSLKTRPFWLEAGLSVLVVGLSFITVYKAF